MIFQYFCKIFVLRSEGPPLSPKNIAQSKFKAFALDKKIVVKLKISVSERVEKNTVGKGENVDLQHFFHFLTVVFKRFLPFLVIIFIVNLYCLVLR